jgi:hypothetical protein
VITLIGKEILLIFSLAAISLGLYYSLKKYVFRKYRIKKKHILISMISVMVLFFVTVYFNPKNQIFPQVFMIVFIIMYLLYLDISKLEKIEKNKPAIGKPKPKPNRIKNYK